MTRRRKKGRRAGTGRLDSGLGANRKGSEARQAQDIAAIRRRRRVLAGVVACFMLSGFAALLYQTIWLRQFSLIFGTSELAVATVLAAYMAGLAAGAALIRRFMHRVDRPILVYGLLEGGIAITALAVPLLLWAAGSLYVAVLGGLPEPPSSTTLGQPMFYLAVGFIVLALPTAFMGATLPLLARHAVESDRQVGPRLALLYGVNTAGAVFGTLAAAFWLLPVLGLTGTIWVGVVVNTVVFLVAWRLAALEGCVVAPAPETAAVAERSRDVGFYASSVRPLVQTGLVWRERLRHLLHQPVWILPFILVSGINAFLYEVLWTRMLTHVIGGSVYAFATMLAAFLTGIALGGGFAGGLAQSRQRAATAFAVCQLLIAVFSAAVYFWIEALIPDTRGTREFAIYAIVVMLPSTIFIGATFPLAVRVLTPNEELVAEATARIYSWNTVGAIIGAVSAGFVIIPAIGFEGAIRLAVLLNLALASLTLLLITAAGMKPATATAVLLIAAAFLYDPGRPDAVVTSTAIAVPETASRRERFYAPGRSSTVLITEADGKLDLRTNGLPEASILPKGAPPLGQVQHWMVGLPIAARPDAERVLLIGFGGGVALENVPSSVQSIDAIELEPEVIAANRSISEERLADPLADPRIRVVLNDARNALRLTDKQYDIIVSQPSHPWTAGASHLFTREFMQLAKAHLSDGGVFLQWVGAGFIDEALLKSLAGNLLESYENVRLYQTGGSILFWLASDEPIDIERQLLATGQPLRSNVLYYSYMGLNGVDDFVASLVMDEEGTRRFGTGAAPITDNRNTMATHSRALGDGFRAVDVVDLLASYDPLLDAESWLRGEFAANLDLEHIASRMLTDGLIQRTTRFADTIGDPSARAFVTGLIRGQDGKVEGVIEAFEESLAANPRSQKARYALVEPLLPLLANNRAPAELRSLAAGLNGPAAAIVRGWALAANGDWEGLARLDRELASANATEIWYPEAVQLRADWRTKVTGETRYAFDAIRMIDRALIVRPKLDLFLLRAAAADILNDDASFVEASRYALAFVRSRLGGLRQGGVPVSQPEISVTRRRLVSLRAKLDSFGDDVPRAAEVAAGISEEIELLERLSRGLGQTGQIGSLFPERSQLVVENLLQ